MIANVSNTLKAILLELYHVGRQLRCHLSWNVANLGTHDIVNPNSIAIILIIGIPIYDDTFTWVGTAPIKAYTNDLCGNNTYFVWFSIVSTIDGEEPILFKKEHTIEDGGC